MRLLSYNIHKGIGGKDRKYRLERILDVIEKENPDLICLQEVDRNVRRSRFQNQPHIFMEYFNNSEALFQMNVKLRRGGYGNLILSRWPLLSHHHLSLRFHKKKPRGAQLAIVDTPQGKLHLVNWHLGLSEKERHWQVDHLTHHRLFRESQHLPTIIAGDCNDWRNSLGNGAFSLHGFRQITTPLSRFRTFPAYLAVGSLDKAFQKGHIGIHHAKVVRSRLAKMASDHLPLVLDFNLGNRLRS